MAVYMSCAFVMHIFRNSMLVDEQAATRYNTNRGNILNIYNFFYVFKCPVYNKRIYL